MPEPRFRSMEEFHARYFRGEDRFELKAREIAAMVMAGIDANLVSRTEEEAARMLNRVREILRNTYRWPVVHSDGATDGD